jgi:hypothetical protein
MNSSARKKEELLAKKQASSIQDDGKDADIEEDDGPELLPLDDIAGMLLVLLSHLQWEKTSI